MARSRRRIVLLSLLGLCLSLPGLLWGVLQVDAVRQRLGRWAVAEANAALVGRIEVDAVERLDPFGVDLAGVRVFDGRGEVVGKLRALRLRLSPLGLLFGEVHVPVVAVEGLWADLGQDGKEGLLQAVQLVEPEPATEEPPGEPWTLRLDEVRARDWEVAARLEDAAYRVRLRRLAGASDWGSRVLSALSSSRWSCSAPVVSCSRRMRSPRGWQGMPEAVSSSRVRWPAPR